MKARLYRFWEIGYLYFAIYILLILIYALNKRIGIADWPKEIAYFQFIKASLTSFHSIPWFWWNKLDNISWYPAIAYTSNFVGNPETMLFSPFTPLLLLINVLTYIKFLVIIHCFIGIVGILVLKRRFQWNFQQVRTYSILFLFSPIIFQHLSIGYTPCLNLFFFPWLIYFISDEKASSSILGTSAILGLVLLQGGMHVFVWYVMFISLYYVLKTYFERNWSFLLRLLGIFCLAALLSSLRIYTSTQAYAGFHQSFVKGYNPINFLFWALIPPVFVPPFSFLFTKMVWMGVPSWDGGIFWGLGIVMVLVLGKNYRNYKRVADQNLAKPNIALMYDSIFIISIVLLILSFIYGFIINTLNAVTHIPFADGVEKYPYRLAIPAFLGFSVVIAGYSKLISQSLDEYRHHLGKLSMISKLSSALKFFSFAGLAGLSAVLMVSVIFSRAILKIYDNIISEAYYGTGNHWFSQLMVLKSINSLAYYLKKGEAIYFQSQISLLIILAVSIVVLFFMRSGIMGTADANEFMLAVPLVGASIMWLSLSISVPYNNYPVQNILAPELTTKPANIKPLIDVSPQKITLTPREGSRVIEYSFPKITSADSHFLDVASDNAIIIDSNGMFSLVPLDNRPITVEFNSIYYHKTIALMIFSWLGVIGFAIARLVLISLRRRNVSKGR